jgi:hypothetical protein
MQEGKTETFGQQPADWRGQTQEASKKPSSRAAAFAMPL